MSFQLPTRSLVSQQDAAVLQRPDVPRSKFIGRKTRKMTFDAGYLVPFHLDEVYPGDHFKYSLMAYVRLSTPLFPMFDNQKFETHWWFVPMRLLWDNFVKFMGEQDNPGDSTAFTIPQNVSGPGGFPQNSVMDHFGLPVQGQITAGETVSVNALPMRAYAFIYNQWYRDENLINSIVWSKGNGPDAGLSALQKRGKAHDYFTSCLPSPQKGTAQSVPLAGTAPITGIGNQSTNYTVGPSPNVTETGGGVVQYGFYQTTDTAARWTIKGSSAAGGQPQIFANLSAATASMSINTLRQAWALQAMLERDARGGTRYTEKNRAVFGVVSPDQRLQRPEYIGGGSSQLNITPIAQTTPTGGGGLGALGGAGTAAGEHRASYAATEHGYIIGILSVRSELSYQQGINRIWRRSTQADMYDPLMAGLGEQAVLLEEIYATGVDAADVTVFGYQERFHELRTMYSDVTGKFRSTQTGTIDPWHLAQRFSPAPTLGQTFIEDSPPMTRVLAAGAAAAEMQYLALLDINREAIRPLPMYGTPSTLGRM